MENTIKNIFPEATDEQMIAIMDLVNSIIERKVESAQMDKDKLNIVSVGTGKHPNNTVQPFVQTVAQKFEEIFGEEIQCLFVAQRDGEEGVKVIPIEKEIAQIVEIPVGMASDAFIKMHMDQFAEFEKNLLTNGYNVKFYPRHSNQPSIAVSVENT